MTRALVLGGGGPVGIAWESGLVAGLAAEGVDLAAADYILGTSAGSVVGAQLALGRPASSLVQGHLGDGAQQERGNPTPGAPPPNLMPLMELMQRAASGQTPPEQIRREIGQFALKAETPSEVAFISSFGALISSAAWPARGYGCSAVDAETGEFVVWGSESGVELGRAVASSCSVPGVYPPITINGHRYMDGGMRSATNADCVKGHDRVVVVAVTVGAEGPMADVSRARLEGELASLRATGAQVELVTPGKQAQETFGLNLMDFRRRRPAAEAGLAQGHEEAARLKAFWD